MKKTIYLICFILTYYTSQSQLSPAPTGIYETNPSCDELTSCQTFNGIKTINGTNLSNSNFYFGENCNNIQLFTKEVQYALGANIAINRTYRINDINNINCSIGVLNYDLNYKSLHWSAEQTLKYFTDVHSLASISPNNIHIQTLYKPEPQTGYQGWQSFNGSRDEIFFVLSDPGFYDGFSSSPINEINLRPGFVYNQNGSTLNSYSPVSLDYVGMMWTYILLNNLGFSSALNNANHMEYKSVLHSYAEIFGVLIENYAEQGNGDWLFGEDMCSNTTIFSNLENFQDPSTAGHPKVYQGNNWLNNWVNVYLYEFPINSGPHNHWFYLLTEGGSGVNENGVCYNVQGLGFSKSSDIIYRAMTNYLSHTNPDYQNSKNATIQAAIDLYGANSPELASVIAAWQAVGVIPPQSSIPTLVTNGGIVTINTPADINGTFVIPYGTQMVVNNTTIKLGHNAHIIIEDGGSLRIDNSTVLLGQNAKITKNLGLGFFKTDNSVYNYFSSCPSNNPLPFWGGLFLNSDQPNSIEITNCVIQESALGIDMNSDYFTFNGNEYIDNLKPVHVRNTPVGVFNEIYNSYFSITSSIYNTNQTYNFIRVENADLKIGRQQLTQSNDCFFEQQDPTYKVEAIICENNLFNPVRRIDIYRNLFNACNKSISNNLNVDMRVVANIFQNSYTLDNAITNTLVKKILIEGNYFDNISRNIYNLNSRVKIYSNKFNIPAVNNVNLPSVQENYGIFSIGSISDIQYNSMIIQGTSIGSSANLINAYAMVFENSGPIVSTVFANDIISKNEVAIETQGNNANLKIKCNRFAGNTLVPILIADGSIFNFGTTCFTDNTQQAGNEFHFSNGTNGLIVKGPNALNFDYYAHKEIAGGFANTIPTALWFNGSANTDYLHQCDGFDGPPNTILTYPIQIKNQNSCATALSWKPNSGDSNNNAELSDKINEKLSFKQVLISDYNILDNLLTDPSTQNELIKKLDALQKEISLVNDDLVAMYEALNNHLAAKSILENAASIESKMILLEKYTAEEDFVNADRVRNEIYSLYKEDYFFENFDEEINYDENKEDFMYLEELKKEIKLENRDVTQLNTNELFDLAQIKTKNLPISATAEALLILNGDSLIVHEIRKIDLPSLNDIINSNLNIDTFDYQLSVSPNPANNIIQLSYVLPFNVSEATIKIIDQYTNLGQELYAYDLLGNQTNYALDVNSLPNGNYLVVLQIDGFSKTSTQLMIIR